MEKLVKCSFIHCEIVTNQPRYITQYVLRLVLKLEFVINMLCNITD